MDQKIKVADRQRKVIQSLLGLANHQRKAILSLQDLIAHQNQLDLLLPDQALLNHLVKVRAVRLNHPANEVVKEDKEI